MTAEYLWPVTCQLCDGAMEPYRNKKFCSEKCKRVNHEREKIIKRGLELLDYELKKAGFKPYER